MRETEGNGTHTHTRRKEGREGEERWGGTHCDT